MARGDDGSRAGGMILGPDGQPIGAQGQGPGGGQTEESARRVAVLEFTWDLETNEMAVKGQVPEGVEPMKVYLRALQVFAQGAASAWDKVQKAKAQIAVPQLAGNLPGDLKQ